MKTITIITFLSWRFQLLSISNLTVWETVSVSECLPLLFLEPLQIDVFPGDRILWIPNSDLFYTCKQFSWVFAHPISNVFEVYLSVYLLSENYQQSLFKSLAKQYLMISCLNVSGIFLNVAYFVLTFPLLADTYNCKIILHLLTICFWFDCPNALPKMFV